MRYFVCCLLALTCGFLSGCRPDGPITHFEPGGYTLLCDPWSRYFRSPAKLYVVPSLSRGARALLREEQELAKAILTGSGRLEDRPEYGPLSAALDELKSALPSVVTRTTSSTGSYRTSSGSRSVAYASEDYSYAKNGGGSEGYCKVFRSVERQSSPALARSVDNVVANATLEDLGQRIDALEQLIEVWSRKTRVMLNSGADGAIRMANETYLASLKDYVSDFKGLNVDLDRVKADAAKDAAFAQERVSAWQAFEKDQQAKLHAYMQENASQVIDAVGYAQYTLPRYSGLVIMACEIGGRTLYFNLSQVSHDPHPFRLVGIR